MRVMAEEVVHWMTVKVEEGAEGGLLKKLEYLVLVLVSWAGEVVEVDQPMALIQLDLLEEAEGA